MWRRHKTEWRLSSRRSFSCHVLWLGGAAISASFLETYNFGDWLPRTPLLVVNWVIKFSLGLRRPPGQKTGNTEESSSICCLLPTSSRFIFWAAEHKRRMAIHLIGLLPLAYFPGPESCALAFRLENRHPYPQFTVPLALSFFSPFHLSLSLSAIVTTNYIVGIRCYHTCKAINQDLGKVISATWSKYEYNSFPT